jgi:hypothetical protein
MTAGVCADQLEGDTGEHNNSLEPTPMPESWFASRSSVKVVAAALMRRGGSALC